MNFEKVAENVIPMLIMALITAAFVLYTDVGLLKDNQTNHHKDYKEDKEKIVKHILTNHDNILIMQQELKYKNK